MATADTYELETLIDNCGLDNLIEAISDICTGKAEHLRSNWQDDSTAKTWEQAARYMLKVAASVSVRTVS